MYPKLVDLVKGYDAFLNSQRSLFVVAHPELGLNDKVDFDFD
jgi:hypothetical protein